MYPAKPGVGYRLADGTRPGPSILNGTCGRGPNASQIEQNISGLYLLKHTWLFIQQRSAIAILCIGANWHNPTKDKLRTWHTGAPWTRHPMWVSAWISSMHVPTRAPSRIDDACPQDTLFSPRVDLARAPSYKTRHLCNVLSSN